MQNKLLTEDGIPVGNVYDKYETRNPIARRLVTNFLASVLDLVDQTGAQDVHEVGCGEGNLTRMIAQRGVARVRGSDFSCAIIDVARQEPALANVSFVQKDIYSLDAEDSAELIVCCEVLEHLDRPEEALRILASTAKSYCIISVPREPIWRCLNFARGKYVTDFGNTPGHIQHWSKGAIIRLCQQYFNVVDVRLPVPWTILLGQRRDST